MKLIIDDQAGFCFGVKRSADLVLSSSNKGKIEILGELIHNQDYINFLEEKGIHTINSLDEMNRLTKNIVIRAHGISKDIECDLQELGINIIDATCPFVKKIQAIAQEYEKKGYQVIILGEESHPEVISEKSYVKNAIVIQDIQDLPSFPKDSKILLISQTTQSHLLFKKISDALHEIYPGLVAKETICEATSQKQKSVIELSQKVDLLYVIGGKNSCNTQNLVNVAKPYTEVIKIENAKEIDLKSLEGVKTLGITAGASTPDYIITEVYDMLNSLNKVGAR